MDWYELLPKILNMSLTASVISVTVIILRLLLKRAPKVYSYMLWLVVLFRLLCPITINTPLSVLGLFDPPIVETTDSVSQVAYIPNNIVHTENPEVTLPVPVLDNAINNALPQGAEQLVADPLEAPVSIATYIWLAGIVAMIGVSMISYVKLRKSLVGAVRVRGNIYVADYITTPFVLGIFRPRIYLLSSLSEQEQEYILKHEQYHIRRGDHIFKLLAYVALCIHWLFRLERTDILSCNAISEDCNAYIEPTYYLNSDEVKYDELYPNPINHSGKLVFTVDGGTDTNVLAVNEEYHKYTSDGVIVEKETYELERNAQGKFELEVAVRGDHRDEAIYFIYVYGKSGFYAMKIDFQTSESALAIEVPGTMEIDNMVDKTDSLDTAILNAIIEHTASDYPDGAYHCASFVEFHSEELCGVPIADGNISKELIMVYGMALEQSFSYSEGKLNQVGGSHMPVVITFEVADNTYTVTDFWVPRDGSYYVSDIRDKFPDEIEEDALDTQKYVVAQIQECYSRAVQYYQVDTEAVIEELFDKMEASPATASNPADYIDAHSLEYRELMYYGQYSLNYIFHKFMEGEQKGLRGQLMKILLDDLAPEAKLRLYAETGQEYFDEWAKGAVEVLEQHDMEWIKENQPAMWIYLQMVE